MKNINEVKGVKLSENFLDNIINLTGEPIFVKDVNFKFVLANDALCEMLGMKREDIIGKTLGESLPKDQMDTFLKNDRAVLESGKENINEEPLTGKGGKILTIITKKTRYVDEEGSKFLIGVIHDITEKKAALDELQEKVTELEKVNKIMVDRELKMVELKKQINELGGVQK